MPNHTSKNIEALLDAVGTVTFLTFRHSNKVESLYKEES